MESGQRARPNVVLIMSDQHNARVMGCGGNEIVQTPHLDALARGGVQFTNVYCPYPLCVPSRMAFMTARYPSEIASWDNGSILASDVPTFAHSLGAAGYEAVLCGRMHFTGYDQYHGFERRIVAEAGETLTPEIKGAGYNRTTGQTKYAVQVAGYGHTGVQYYDNLVTDRACEFISGRGLGERPYCLVVGMLLPHNPLICTRRWFDHYMDIIPMPTPMPEAYLRDLHPAMRRWRERRGVDDLTPQQNHRALAAYYGLVTELDANVGHIVQSIRSSAEGDNTVIIYCSDHGDMACELGMWWKSSFYDGSARVSCIVSWPGRFAEGRMVDAVISLIDLGPTLLDILGAEPLPQASGKSVAALLQGAPPDEGPHEVFSEYLGFWGDLPAAMIRRGPWKLNTYQETRSHQLFNLEEDPHETHDLANDPRYRQVAQDCLQRIDERWSAERMMLGAEAQHQAMDIISACGHELVPHPPAAIDVPNACNQFDFQQLEGLR